MDHEEVLAAIERDNEILICAFFCIPLRFCPSFPQPPSPTMGEGGVWAS